MSVRALEKPNCFGAVASLSDSLSVLSHRFFALTMVGVPLLYIESNGVTKQLIFLTPRPSFLFGGFVLWGVTARKELFFVCFSDNHLETVEEKRVPCSCPCPTIITRDLSAYLICGECGLFFI